MKKRTKKQWILIIALGVGAWFISQAWIYFSKEAINKEIAKPKTSMTTEERANAIKACVDGGLNEKMCACIVDKTTNEFTLAEMGEMNEEMKKNGTSLVADMIVRECASEVMPDYELNKN